MLSVQSSTGERRVLVCWERNAPKRTTSSHLFFFFGPNNFFLLYLTTLDLIDGVIYACVCASKVPN